MRYEIWRYSASWKKWIRDVYPNEEDACRRYEQLKRHGKRAKPPQPVDRGMPITARVEMLIDKFR